MENELKIGFGALQPKISTQLKAQGFKFSTDKIMHYENLRESISYLIFNNLITDKVMVSAQQKLFNKIKAHIKDKNKC